MKVYRSVDGSDTPGARNTDDEDVRSGGLSAPHVLLTGARLLLLIKFVALAPFEFLVVLAHAKNARRSWFRRSQSTSRGWLPTLPHWRT